jgi:hypothetical protein
MCRPGFATCMIFTASPCSLASSCNAIVSAPSGKAAPLKILTHPPTEILPSNLAPAPDVPDFLKFHWKAQHVCGTQRIAIHGRNCRSGMGTCRQNILSKRSPQSVAELDPHPSGQANFINNTRACLLNGQECRPSLGGTASCNQWQRHRLATVHALLEFTP